VGTIFLPKIELLSQKHHNIHSNKKILAEYLLLLITVTINNRFPVLFKTLGNNKLKAIIAVEHQRSTIII